MNDRINGLTVDQLNGGLACYRADLRLTREDAEAFVTWWNKHRINTVAAIIDNDGIPFVVILDS